MRHSPLCLLAALALLLLAPTDASAKDLRGKFGLGFNNNFTGLTSISIKGGLPMPKPTQNLQVQGLVGFGLGSVFPDRLFVGGRVLIPILAEDNLNLYAGVGAGYLMLQPDDKDLPDVVHAFRGQAVLGVEFFFFGLEQLGLSAELGINFDGAEKFLSFSTTSGIVTSVGVHYYFGMKGKK